ncbi:PTS-dependent dihydroxyacetone kinase phosphotransferase subunit DhaM [Streptomyces erythrochromogenes]|uniref:PTS-dependent dihydroxyacetone kinase phosphotransferase subunit DhaM n=1 Tax=Streptomyces erythrochromogenes TaxID=285574 RepID=UPI00225BE566|nr:PTS fructose transporter subunit IIA [Streptomyces erythrochromogenes]MCX5588540.1 PTS fructose transporter subunit IIA [Streptomyces erythrochromogenes]
MTGGHGDGGTQPALVGVVLVSHSGPVAESVAELARGLAAGGPVAPVAAAGGTSAGGLGTSAERIVAAAREVDRGAGVALLADLGSSVLTVKTLLLEDELPPESRLVDAPFVEGAVAAVVAASAGAPLAQVAEAAAEAYAYRKV